MESRIDFKSIDKKWQEYWKDSKIFRSVPNNKKAFTMTIPPPNITGNLHIGHALNNTFIDIVCRYKRMMGYNVCMVPGFDHASIATETKVKQYLQSNNIDEKKLTREEFLAHVFEWKDKYSMVIKNQLKKLGLSCDWDRESFTMSPEFSEQVKDTFVKMYNDELIYRGNYLCNWCPILKTVISDEEINEERIKGKLYYLKYKIVGEDDYILVATSRPSTIFGDTAVAYNPSDERYKKYKGKKVLIPIINREIPLIEDDYVKIDFGSGLVKITPCHDKNDFEVGMRHNLEMIKIFNDMCQIEGTNTKYDGMDRETCTRIIVRDLRENNLLEKIEEYDTVAKKCYRTGAIIETMPSKQWFVKMKPLAEIARKLVEDKKIKISPEKNINIFYHWIDTIHDWNISRQLSWGHRIPIWYCNNCKKTICSKDAPSECSECHGKELTQDSDVMCTWFSSMLWSHGVFEEKEREYYCPTDLLITGEDILFFWVIKMIMSSGYLLNREPFKEVYLHGLVRDTNNKKMSKSLGNIIDPLTLIEKIGTDPLRLSITLLTPKNGDLKISEKSMEIGKKFCTKYWNIVRYITGTISDTDALANESELLGEDLDMVNKLNESIRQVHGYIENNEFSKASDVLYKYTWDDFANVYLEYYKKNSENESRKILIINMIYTINKMLHPFIPHITEEIGEILKRKYTYVLSREILKNKTISEEEYPREFTLKKDV